MKIVLTYAIPEPVGSGREGDAAGADGQGENFADDNPGAWTPCRGEEEDVNADEGDFGLDGRRVCPIRGSGDGDDEFANDHAQRTPDQQRTTPKSLNRVEGNGCGADVDKGGDETDEERVADRAELLEEGRTKVEDEVDTGPLLHHLERCTQDCTANVALLFEQGTGEAIDPRCEVAALGNHLQFVFVIGDDLSELGLHEFRIAGLATQTTEHIGSSINLASLDEVAGRFGEKEETYGQDYGPKYL